jgi:antitoxin component of MazEF toxin-antitoxin module
MAELFRLKIASGNDVILPPRLMSRLQLRECGELRIQVDDDDSLTINKVRKPETPVPSEKTLEELKHRAAHSGSRELVEKFLEEVRAKRQKRRKTHVAQA